MSKKYDNVILLGDFNNKPEEKNVKFPKHLPFEKYCQAKDLFQKPDRSTCIDLILTNSSGSFQDTFTLEAGLSDFHKLVFTIPKIYIPNKIPVFKPSETIKDSRMIYLDGILIMSDHKFIYAI